MITGRAEYTDEFLKSLKRDLDRLLPLKAEESTMLGKTRQIVNSKIDHIQFSIAQCNEGD